MSEYLDFAVAGRDGTRTVSPILQCDAALGERDRVRLNGQLFEIETGERILGRAVICDRDGKPVKGVDVSTLYVRPVRDDGRQCKFEWSRAVAVEGPAGV